MANKQLTNKQIARLAEAISGPSMETIAQGYLDIDPENITAIKHENFYKIDKSNRDVLKRWAYRNPGPNQVGVSCIQQLALI